KIDNSVFHTNETQKPDDVDGYQYEALPVYPPMKPDEPGPLYMQKPDEPDMIQETHGGFGAHMAVPEHQKPNEVEDMNSDEFRRHSVERMRAMVGLADYVVVFFHDSHAIPTASFKSSIQPLVNMRKKHPGYKYAQIDTQQVPIPRDRFGFEAYSGVVFYRKGQFVNYMNGFGQAQFQLMLDRLPTLEMHDIRRVVNHKLEQAAGPAARTVTLLGNGQDIIIPGAGVEKVVIHYK
ncbi:hypothetical protein IWW51_002552, partial [Coemansia sp. RSA 2702]